MTASATFADRELLLGSLSSPEAWARTTRPTLFGDVVLIVFLLAQCFDGVFTYVGVKSFGPGIEANPLLATMMGAFGHGIVLTLAKTAAAALGICLHLREIHGAVAMLAGFYIIAAIVPWMMILF